MLNVRFDLSGVLNLRSASRQRLLLTARELGLLSLPEGGGYFDWDLTYIIDGKTVNKLFAPIS